MKSARELAKATVKEMLRERAFLFLTLIVAPLFILVYRLIFLQGMVAYRVGFVEGPNSTFASLVSKRIEENDGLAYSDGAPLFAFRRFENRSEAENAIRDRSIYLFVTVEPLTAENRVRVCLAGDFSDPYYLLAATAARSAIEEATSAIVGMRSGIEFVSSAVGDSGGRTPFENYVPGLILVSSIAGIYLFSLILARERDHTTTIRYRIARLPCSAIVAGKGAAFLSLSVFASLLAFASAYALGFGSAESAWIVMPRAMVFIILNSASTVGISFAVSACARNLYHALSLAAFPFLFSTFFSGSVYPLPEFVVLRIAGLEIRLFDFLPATHAVHGIHRILIFGDRLGDLSGRLVALAVLAVLYLFSGGILYKREVLGGETRRTELDHQG